MELNEKIRMVRELKQWSQEEMADKMGMSKNGYAKIEQGKSNVNWERLQQITDIFQIDLMKFLNAGGSNSLICLVSDNGDHHNNTLNYNCDRELLAEIDKLKMAVAHKDELLEQRNQELATLKEMFALLKKQMDSDK
ncbi:XRE family transcriptional regulator [Conchiformibius steedae]|uniref:XRE family transcriptional regulator n=2 Tax=Conchiformibius steedae TaxID=153493 RepID=A0A3P2AC12_9NEIS|nr:XRE family transcriptional regulator [Conchiformibius steedae]